MKLYLVALLAMLLLSFVHAEDAKKVDLSDSVNKMEDDKKDDDKKDDAKKPGITEDENGNQIITAKVEDTITLSYSEPQEEEKKYEWALLEAAFGSKDDFIQVVGDNVAVTDDGKTATRTFKIKLLKEGDTRLTFVRGDKTKLDDAEASFKKHKGKKMDLKKMDVQEYSQVKVKIVAK